jgi:hypothetical protein
VQLIPSHAVAVFIPTAIYSVKFRTTMRVSGYFRRRRAAAGFDSRSSVPNALRLAGMSGPTGGRNRPIDRYPGGLFNWSFPYFVVDVAKDYGQACNTVRSAPGSVANPHTATPGRRANALVPCPDRPNLRRAARVIQGLTRVGPTLKSGANCALLRGFRRDNASVRVAHRHPAMPVSARAARSLDRGDKYD